MNEKDKMTGNKGGKREGAGRKAGPAGKKVQFCTRISPDIKEWLVSKNKCPPELNGKSAPQLIEDAIRKTYGVNVKDVM